MPIANARHILVKTKDEADKLKLQLSNGAEFDRLALKQNLAIILYKLYIDGSLILECCLGLKNHFTLRERMLYF